MTKYLISTIPVFIIVLLLALCTQNTTIDSKAFAQLPAPNPSNPPSVATNNNVTMTIHTTNSILGNNFNAIKQVEPVIRRAILSNINNAIFVARGNAKSLIPVNVNAKIINQLNNNRVDTTQGIDMTKKIITTELINAINATTPNLVSHFVHQPARVVVDNQASCSNIASPTKAACSFTVNIHS
ncbi:MAG TPA: hypothetical protein VH481_04835 [Nitrososphaeraceae archaeon]|jgi:hypothetical protein